MVKINLKLNSVVKAKWLYARIHTSKIKACFLLKFTFVFSLT